MQNAQSLSGLRVATDTALSLCSQLWRQTAVAFNMQAADMLPVLLMCFLRSISIEQVG